MNRFLCSALLCAVSLCSVAPAADAVLVINKDGSYQVMVDGPDGRAVLQTVTQVIDRRGGGGGGGGGTAPLPPTTDELATRIATMSKTKVTDGGIGSALAVGLNVALKRAQTDDQVQTLMNVTVTAIGLNTTSKATCDAWFRELQATPGFTFTVAGLRSTVNGLATAYNVDPTLMKAVVDESVAGFDSGKTPADVLDKVAAAHPTEAAAFDFMKIIELIMAILQLLKDTGILGG